MAVRFRGLALTFDDILLEPAKSSVFPPEVNLETQLTKKIKIDTPIISSASDTVTEFPMALAMARIGGVGVIHRNLSIEKQTKEVKKVKRFDRSLKVAAAIGAGEDVLDRSKALVQAGVVILVIDTAHGHHKNVIKSLILLRKTFLKVQIIVGNVATAEAAYDIIKHGADAIKVGIGSGSICTTRDVAGVGVPQFTAIEECSKVAKRYKVPVIADGGIVYPSDLVKSLAAGASVVMMGNMLAGTDESPGKIMVKKGKRYKRYRGMGSSEAMKVRGNDKYFHKEVPEGVSALVPYKGSVENVVRNLTSSLKTAMGYYGAKKISDLWKVKYWQVTGAGMKESHTHSIVVDE